MASYGWIKSIQKKESNMGMSVERRLTKTRSKAYARRQSNSGEPTRLFSRWTPVQLLLSGLRDFTLHDCGASKRRFFVVVVGVLLTTLRLQLSASGSKIKLDEPVNARSKTKRKAKITIVARNCNHPVPPVPEWYDANANRVRSNRIRT
jgi:hypothetical protein